MPANDLSLLIDAAKRAGEVARSFVGGALDIQQKPDDLGPVTAADLAVNAVLERMLREARPDYGWLSEESVDDARRLSAERVFIIDPIDGTRSFIEGSNMWAHALAVAERGRVIAGVVYLPMRDTLYSACIDGGAFRNGDPISPATRTDPNGAEVLMSKPTTAPEHWQGGMPEIKRAFRPSLAYRQSLVADGRFDAMLSFRPTWEWDIAAGAVILEEAGATVTDAAGLPLEFNRKHPQSNGILAANSSLHSTLLGHVLGHADT